MSWTTIATIKVMQDWQFTPVIPLNLGYVRLSFSTAGIPVSIAQVDLNTEDLSSERQLMATPYAQILEFPSPPVFTSRAIALRLPVPTTPFDVQIEVSSIPMPFISTGSNAPTNATVGSVTTVAASIQAVNLLEANPNRKKLIVINNSTATMYLAFGEVASAANHTIAIIADGDGYELEGFTGIVSAAWTAANGQARITEFE